MKLKQKVNKSIEKIQRELIYLMGKYRNVNLGEFIDNINKKIKNKEELTKDEKNIIEILKKHNKIKWSDKEYDTN